MNKIVIVAVAMGMLTSTTVLAQEGSMPTTQGLLENICIGSRLDEKLLEPFVQQTATFFKAKSMKIEPEMLPSVNPDATSGWVIGKGDRSFIVAFAKKVVEGTPSISCSVATQADDNAVAALRRYIETTYNTRKIADQKQGGTTVAVYRAELLGFSSPKKFSVQQVHAGAGLDGMVMVSFFDSSP
ncbi:hypothetical protein ASF69_01575 [Rhizobium sp. Leaf311]|uniref:hypothetical protein n=1 Tax=Rhizobium sp. Leaf311 TaxID=1736332 RepID=UPI00071350CE|nr:hypothetical protein [Rhizobium sp. Leaf311]KQQ61139.1 hypothetical protein ASF69_01575 [Rhizobium sp. Leaf311]